MIPDDVAEVLAGPCEVAAGAYRLVPMADTDVDAIFAHFGDAAVTEYMDIERLEARFQTWDVIDWAAAVRAAGTGLRWSIRDAEDRFIGTAGFHGLDYRRGRRGEIGYDLKPSHWGRGVMAQVLPAVIAFGFGPLRLHRLEAMITPGNGRSQRLLERHDFVLEGTLRDYGFWKGRFWDQMVFARLAPAPLTA